MAFHMKTADFSGLRYNQLALIFLPHASILRGATRSMQVDEWIRERYGLSVGRIREIPDESIVEPAFNAWFKAGAEWFLLLDAEHRFLTDGSFEKASVEELSRHNHALYEEILPQNYGRSYANPSYACEALGEKYGREWGPLLSAVRYEMRSVIPFVYRGCMDRVLVRMELFLEIYSSFVTCYRENRGAPPYAQIWNKVYLYLGDYAEEEERFRIEDRLIGSDSFGLRVLKSCCPDPGSAGNWSETSLRSLYRYGEYITDDEILTARHLADLPEEKAVKMADTYTEGYRMGFVLGGKNLASKKTVGLVYHIGFERMMRRAVDNFAEMGLGCAVPSEVPTLFYAYRPGSAGYSGAVANPQYVYDHREDLALFLDDTLVNRRLEALESAYRELHDSTVLYAGPAVLETFGERPFAPVIKPEAPRYSRLQQKLTAGYARKASAMYSDAVVARDRSFTIIDFPLPQIAGSDVRRYEEIFDAIYEINTLDYVKYRDIQSKMIDVLNTAEHVEVLGKNGNITKLRVKLVEPENPQIQANFENCVADVNIPVGEVFTTPVLKGTEGVLHVSEVYLQGLRFVDLELHFTDGRVTDYRCGNFDDPQKGREYIEENILFHHRNLPMGECAVGTNTTAYCAARKFGIADRLPILIAEKTGPHFAVGDTCYSHDEENRVYNPDGREIIAKDNEVSILRKADPGRAYFGCHTDITIPYEELGEFTAVRSDGTRIPILKDGRFVLPGTEQLNEPLDREERVKGR